MSTSTGKVTGITAKELHAKSDRRLLQNVVHEQVRVIDAAILTAHAAGLDCIGHELPTNFNVSNINKSDAQLYVYSELINIYRRPESEGGKGFTDVVFERGPPPKIFIKWMNGLSPEEREERRKIVLESTRQPRAR
jgi:hypothetical protein